MNFKHLIHITCIFFIVIFQSTQQNAVATTFLSDSVIWEVRGACGMCKKRIEQHAQGAGLITANWSAHTETLTLIFEENTYQLDAAKQRILASGHEVNGEPVDPQIYAKLPACCRYNDPDNPHFKGKASNDKQFLLGVILEENSRSDLKPLPHVNLRWLEAQSVHTQTDNDGVFQIPYSDKYKHLILSFSGRTPDTISVQDHLDMLVITLNPQALEAVTVSSKRPSNYISRQGIGRVEVLSSQELFKAACCDLSESFETNASVDVVNTDAVTGSKQIQMLGLSGIYTQLTVENMPGLRGLSAPMGLSSISGTWIESIQISKGVGSVANGYEQMTGQINVELKKPEGSERLFFNAYTNDMGRSDVNLNLFQKLSPRWSTGLLLHDNFMLNKHQSTSENGFRDIPVGNIFSGISRWRYDNGQGIIAQFGVKFHKDDRVGGQTNFDPDMPTHGNGTETYGILLDADRYEIFSKIGYLFPRNRQRSVGLQLSGVWYEHDNLYGKRTYKGEQRSLYANLIYQDVLGHQHHKIRAGLSTQWDRIDEHLNLGTSPTRYLRKEIVPGAFAEYTYSPKDNLDVVLGMRGDYHNEWGWFATPRLQARFQPWTNTTLRFSTGRGQRSASIFAENSAVLASSRLVSIDATAASNRHHQSYGLGPEISWNTGFSLDQHFRLAGREANFSFEYYRTDFIRQTVADLEDPRRIQFYNLEGSSFANSFQSEFRWMPLPQLEFRSAYRYFDVQTQYKSSGTYLARALSAKHRGFANLGYDWQDAGWQVDFTYHWTGKKRLPSTQGNPSEWQLDEYSPSYSTMNTQITKRFGGLRPIHLYLGVENLGNFYQKEPILAAEEPFGPYFDTALLWGPLTGRMVYAGIRLMLSKE